MSERKSIKFYWFFFPLAAVWLAIGAVSYSSEPPNREALFSHKDKFESIEGTADLFTPPRGVPRLRVSASAGATKFIDCLAVSDLCNQASRGSPPISVNGVGVRLQSQLYWPMTLRANGQIKLNEAASFELYPLFQESRRGLSKFWFALAAGFAILGLAFGRREMFPVTSRSLS